jgi:hypothetical protein
MGKVVSLPQEYVVRLPHLYHPNLGPPANAWVSFADAYKQKIISLTSHLRMSLKKKNPLINRPHSTDLSQRRTLTLPKTGVSVGCPKYANIGRSVG